MKKKLIIICIIILISDVAVAKLKSILVILDEYENPGLNSISTAVKKDFANIKYFIRLLKKRKVIKIAKPIILKGPYATKSRLKKIIKNIKLNKNDVLLIYFSGHGGIGKKGKLYLAMYDDSYVYRHELEPAIRRKKARLKIIITDACSNSIAGLPGGTTRSIKLRSAWGTKNLKILFNKYRGLYYITAASKGEFAYGDSIVGGWFTESIIQQVLIQNPPATWEEVSEQTQENTLIKFKERLPGNKRTILKKEGITGQNPMTFSYPLLIEQNNSLEVQKLSTPKILMVSKGDYKNKILISWKKVKNAEKYIIYKYYKKTKKWKYLTNTASRSYYDKNISPDTIYVYTVIAYRDKTKSGYSKFTKGWAETIKLIAPKKVVVKVKKHPKRVYVRWTAVRGAVGYNIWRWDTKSKSWLLIKKTKQTNYTDKKVKSGLGYGYVIAAYSNVRQGPFSKTAPAWIGLRTPMGVRASQGDYDYIRVSWNKVKNAKSYLLYKWNSQTKKWDKIQNISNNFFIDKKVNPGKKYVYTITAFGKGVWSPLSKYTTGWSRGKVDGWDKEKSNKSWD